MELIATRAISGTVKWRDGEPAARDPVLVLKVRGGTFSPGPQSRAIADDQGRFRLAELPPGRYMVYAFVQAQATATQRPQAALPVFFPGTSSPDVSNALDLRERREPPPVSLVLEEAMLTAARQRAATANVSVEYVPGDMRNFDLDRKFALIFVARNSLLHLHSTEDILAAFAAVRRHLAPGGIFAFDVFNPNVRLLARPSGQRFPAFQVESEPFGRLSVEDTIDYDPATQVGRGHWYISAPANPDAWVLPLELRNIFPQELPLLLAAGGFHLKSRMGDLSQTPFTSASRFQVCLCEATA